MQTGPGALPAPTGQRYTSPERPRLHVSGLRSPEAMGFCTKVWYPTPGLPTVVPSQRAGTSAPGQPSGAAEFSPPGLPRRVLSQDMLFQGEEDGELCVGGQLTVPTELGPAAPSVHRFSCLSGWQWTPIVGWLSSLQPHLLWPRLTDGLSQQPLSVRLVGIHGGHSEDAPADPLAPHQVLHLTQWCPGVRVCETPTTQKVSRLNRRDTLRPQMPEVRQSPPQSRASWPLGMHTK